MKYIYYICTWHDNIYTCVWAGNERYSKLSFLTKLYSIKCKHGASDATMSDVIELLSDAFYNIGAELPSSFYDAKKTVTILEPTSFNQHYSVWPVVLIPYNLPPWLCMKSTSFILSTIVPRPTSPGNDIDVYLQPLIQELNELWSDGVETCNILLLIP